MQESNTVMFVSKKHLFAKVEVDHRPRTVSVREALGAKANPTCYPQVTLPGDSAPHAEDQSPPSDLAEPFLLQAQLVVPWIVELHFLESHMKI